MTSYYFSHLQDFFHYCKHTWINILYLLVPGTNVLVFLKVYMTICCLFIHLLIIYVCLYTCMYMQLPICIVHGSKRECWSPWTMELQVNHHGCMIYTRLVSSTRAARSFKWWVIYMTPPKYADAACCLCWPMTPKYYLNLLSVYNSHSLKWL